MFCSKCGQQCADGIKFCTSCGAELVQVKPVKNEEGEAVAVQETEAVAAAPEVKAEEPKVKKEKVKKEKEEKPEKEKKPVDMTFLKSLLMKKPVWIGAAAVVLLIVVCCIFLGGDEKSKDIEYSGKSVVDIGNIKEDEDFESVLFMDGSILDLDDEEATRIRFSLDRKTVCYENEMDELIIIKDGKVTKTGIEDVYGVVVSDRGDSIAYFTDTDYISYSNDYGYSDSVHVGTLNLYMIKDKKNYEIEEEVVVDTAVLSPNGQTVAYVADFEGETDFKGYYCVKGKKPVEVGKEKRPVALSDKGSYVYYQDEDRVYVMNSKGDAEKLASDISYYFEISFNKDRTQALYNHDGRTYISVKGGAKKKLAGSEFSNVLAKESIVTTGDDFDGGDYEITIVRTGLDSFEGRLLYSYDSDTIFYIKKGYEAEKVASNVYYFAQASNNKSLVYTDDGDIWKVTNFNEGGKPTKMTNTGEVWKVYGAGNLEHIYFLSYDDELFYLKGKKGKKIADDVEDVYVSLDGKHCYYVVDEEEVFCSSEGGKGKKIVTADDVDATVEGGRLFLMTEVDDVVTIYLMDGSKKKEVYSYEYSYDEYDEYWDY